MNRETEDAVVAVLLAKGLVSEADLSGAFVHDEDGRTRVHVVDLVSRGLVSEETIADVTSEIRRARAPAAPGAGGSDAPAPATRYVLERVLGVGAMGRVHEAFDSMLNRRVALKLLVGDDPVRAQRFLVEARAQTRVRHEYVCQVFDVGEMDGTPFIAMQLIDGLPLQKSALEMTLPEKVKTMMEVAEAVHEAHRTGLVHRDLKPSNIMVERAADGSWKPFVLDFGLARDLEGPGLTVTGQTVGTPSYMSPEQARGDTTSMDRRTDVWGLGATLYHVLTGSLPFSGGTALDVMNRVLDSDPPPLRSVVRTIPADLEKIAMKCLEKDVQRRYDSARALAEDLQRYLDGEPVAARAQTLVGRVLRKARKNRLLTSAILVTILALALSLGMA